MNKLSSVYRRAIHVNASLAVHMLIRGCNSYVRALSGSAALTPLATAADTRVLIVGCGAGSLIKGYRAETGCPYPVYSDPTGRIYDTLGMHKTLAMGKKPDYVKMGFLAAVVNGITGGLKGGLTKGGDVTRVGGEWLFRGGECVWCRRMKTTRDHMEVRDVEALLAKEDK